MVWSSLTNGLPSLTNGLIITNKWFGHHLSLANGLTITNNSFDHLSQMVWPSQTITSSKCFDHHWSSLTNGLTITNKWFVNTQNHTRLWYRDKKVHVIPHFCKLCPTPVIYCISWILVAINQLISGEFEKKDGAIQDWLFLCMHPMLYEYIINILRPRQGFQSADTIHAINLVTSGLFTVNTMWTNWNVLSKI